MEKNIYKYKLRNISNSETELHPRSFPKTSHAKSVYNKYNTFLESLQSKQSRRKYNKLDQILNQKKQLIIEEEQQNYQRKVQSTQIRIRKQKVTRNNKSRDHNNFNSIRLSDSRSSFSHTINSLSNIYRMPKFVNAQKIQPKSLIIKPQYFGIESCEKNIQLLLKQLKDKITEHQNLEHIEKVLQTIDL